MEFENKAARGCGIRRQNFSPQSSELRHQITWYGDFFISINDDTFNLDFIGKPSEPVNVTVREIQSNNRSCKLYYKLNWDPPVDSGNTPITKYLVESHPVINRRKNRTVTYSTEHTVCKVQTSVHPDELIVNIRGVNKVGHGLKSENIKMLFYRECFL